MSQPLSAPELLPFIAFAEQLADRARTILSAAGGSFSVELKEDESEVTNLDRQIEEEFRSLVAAHYSEHGVIGEEFAPSNPTADFQWIFDPIDGTQNFSHHIPTFGTIIALHHKGTPIVGVIDHPALNLRYTATKGGGTFCNGKRIAIGELPRERAVHQALLTVSAPSNFSAFGLTPLLTRLLKRHPNLRIYGDCFGQTTIIHGRASGGLQANLRLWDVAALPLLIEEGGGRFTLLESHSAAEPPSLARTSSTDLHTLFRSDTRRQYTAVCGQPRVVEYLEKLLREPY